MKRGIKLNKFDQLVDDLVTGKLSHTQLQIAYRESVRRSKYLPEEAKTILCGSGENDAGLIYQCFKVISGMIGGFELAIRRAKD